MPTNIDAQELNGLDGWFDNIFSPNKVEMEKYKEELANVHQPMLDALQAEYNQKAQQLVAQANSDKANFDREKASLEAQITQRKADKQAQKDKDDKAEADRIKNLPEKTFSKGIDTGGTPEVKKDNTMVVVAVVGGALTITGIIVWVMMNKKKQTVNGTPRRKR